MPSGGDVRACGPGKEGQETRLVSTAYAPPSEYLPRLWFDSLTHDPEALRLLLGRADPGRVMLGTDYPFAMGEAEPGATIRKTATSEEERRALTTENARRFLGLA